MQDSDDDDRQGLECSDYQLDLEDSDQLTRTQDTTSCCFERVTQALAYSPTGDIGEGPSQVGQSSTFYGNVDAYTDINLRDEYNETDTVVVESPYSTRLPQTKRLKTVEALAAAVSSVVDITCRPLLPVSKIQHLLRGGMNPPPLKSLIRY
jgi:hypothetical protein